MYQNIWSEKRANNQVEVHLWDDVAGYQNFIFKNYAYVKDGGGQYRSIYGDKLKKISYWSEEDFKTGKVFESDIPLDTRILIDRYPDSDEVSKNHVELYFDIEVEVTDGFPMPEEAKNKITSVALYDNVSKEYKVYVLGYSQDLRNKNKIKGGPGFGVRIFETEYELLQAILKYWTELKPTIITGWNSDKFDIPYLYNRMAQILGMEMANALSPIGKVVYNQNKKRYRIAGVSSLDYMELYKKFTYVNRSSYRLDYIGQLEVGMGKVEYEGTLDQLLENDIEKFIEYNLVDVKIIVALENKLKLIDLAKAVSHMGRIPYEDVYYSSRYIEGAMLTYLKSLDLVAPSKRYDSNYDDSRVGFSGAYVKNPIPGRYDWVFDLDLTSMYPSTIMTLNISPETKIGKLEGWDAEEFMLGGEKTYTVKKGKKVIRRFGTGELRDFFKKNEVSISSNGILYHLDKKGIIPAILEKWFDERVEYRGLSKKYGEEGNDELRDYFDRRQYVQKILLNSFYGVLGLTVFRFYDLENAEATTTTGVKLIQFTEKIANHYYNNILKTNEDYCIYTDTDSVFYSAIPLVKQRFPNADLNDDKFMAEQILEIADEVQCYINKSYDYFTNKFLNVKGNHRFDIKQEVIAKSAFWVTKKRYGQWIINDGGVPCEKLDVKGLDIVRSSFPPAFQKFMTNILKAVLHKIDKNKIDDFILGFKKKLDTTEIIDISLPSGVKGIKKYSNKSKGKNMFTSMKSGAPVHVKASVSYNDLLQHYKANHLEPIRDHSKIKWVYLKSNPFHLDAIAYKGYDDPDEIMDFISKYIDRDKVFDRALTKKIKMFYDALSWDMPLNKENTVERFF
jgi:DNA polymerase elongation subunit (family B)